MATIFNASVFVDRIATPDLLTAQPPKAGIRPGFWRTLVHRMTTHLTVTPAEPCPVEYQAQRPFELPVDRFVREHPAISVSALAIM